MNLLWLIPALPLFGAIFNALIGRKLPRPVVALVAVGSITAAFVVGLVAVMTLTSLPADARVIHQTLYSWISAGKFSVDASLMLDPLSAVMILVVSGVGALIHLYSVGYMAEDEGFARFFTYLNLFAFSMLLLVLADNYLLLYVGWELVGLCSYLLIGFWFTRDAARTAAVKAFVTNRVGDLGFALGIILMWTALGTLNYTDVFAKAPQVFQAGAPIVTAITLLLFVGATGKSAQIPLYVWLPDAMEGPTPVSALIHAATMVTAGVYMVARSHVLFSLAPISLEIVMIIGALTAFFAATIALVQTDLKRLLAYSTISQLGYMFVGLGVGAFGAGIAHLMTHAFFKALLFLGAGSVMHAMSNIIDMRRLGGLRRIMPATFVTFFIGSLALAGFPGLSGFFSKDEILTSAFASGNYFAWALALLTAGLTAFYIFRGVFMTFFGAPRWQANGHGVSETQHGSESHDAHAIHPHESPSVMTLPLMLLAVLSAIGGYVVLPAVLGANWFSQFLEPVFGANEATVAPNTEWLLISLSTLASVLGIFFAYWFYIRDTSIPVFFGQAYHGFYNLLVNKYYIDQIYDTLFARSGRWLANIFWQVVDKGIIDGAAEGLGNLFRNIGRGLRGLETGYARRYALAMLIGIVIVIGVLVIR
ncbi:MAG: NADH-quinone oxidoreductase subunit L [Anaerolineae bacterium]